MIKIMKYGEVSPKEIFARGTAATDVSGIVRDIIDNVKANGDKALYEYCENNDIYFDDLITQAQKKDAEI